MIQVCDPPRTRQVRRLSTEEFCQLVRGEVSCVYRPRSEVLRMLTVGEAWGTGGVRGAPGAGCILLPMDADVAAAAALRSFLGWGCTAGGYFLTPAAGPDSRAAGTLAPLLAAAAGLPLTVDDAEAIQKSWPGFFADAAPLGVEVEDA